jgi:hypothetical protein
VRIAQSPLPHEDAPFGPAGSSEPFRGRRIKGRAGFALLLEANLIASVVWVTLSEKWARARASKPAAARDRSARRDAGRGRDCDYLAGSCRAVHLISAGWQAMPMFEQFTALSASRRHERQSSVQAEHVFSFSPKFCIDGAAAGGFAGAGELGCAMAAARANTTAATKATTQTAFMPLSTTVRLKSGPGTG